MYWAVPHEKRYYMIEDKGSDIFPRRFAWAHGSLLYHKFEGGDLNISPSLVDGTKPQSLGTLPERGRDMRKLCIGEFRMIRLWTEENPVQEHQAHFAQSSPPYHRRSSGSGGLDSEDRTRTRQ